jgi:hypothetical protein
VRVVIGGITMRFLIVTPPMRAGVRRMVMVDHSSEGAQHLRDWGPKQKGCYDELPLQGRKRTSPMAGTKTEMGHEPTWRLEHIPLRLKHILRARSSWRIRLA